MKLPRFFSRLLKSVRYPSYGGGTYGGRSISEAFGEYVLTRSKVDYSTVRADLSSAVMACVSTVARAFPDAPLTVYEKDAKGQLKPIQDHPLPALFANPNRHMEGRQLLAALVADYLISGNGYLIKERSARGIPVELWPMPASVMRARWPENGSEFLSFWEYYSAGFWYPVAFEDVVHFKNSIEYDAPSWTRLGRSPLKAVLRDVYIDEAASDFAAAIMRNMGMPGVVFTPEGAPVAISPEQREAFLEEYQKRFTGDNRGRAMMLHTPTKLNQVGFDPEKMTLKEVRRVVEERVSAALNVPAICAGLGAGLDRSTLKNTEQAWSALWDACIKPMQGEWSEVLTRSLLPDFDKTGKLVVGFDHKQVQALMEDETETRQRDRDDFSSGGLSHYQWLARLGLEPQPGSPDFYFFPNTGRAVPVGEMPTAPEPAPVPVEKPAPAKERKALDDDPTDADWPEVERYLATLNVPGLQEAIDGEGE